MGNVQQITVELDDELAAQLIKAAQDQEWTPESLAADCVAQHLEIAVRHRTLVERTEAVDAHLATLAIFVGEAAKGSEGLDLKGVCRYGRQPRKAK
ncbi:MAG: hypothetical protein ACLPSW_12260 [Roseiarcus sp.]